MEEEEEEEVEVGEKKEGYFKTRSALHQELVKPNAVKFRETIGFPLNKRTITSAIKCN